MAHAHVLSRCPGHATGPRPSPARITAFSGVIALHATAFVLLMLPMAAYVRTPAVREETIYPQPLRRDPKPLIPVPVPVERPRPAPRTPIRTAVPTPPQPPVVVDTGDEVAPPPGPEVVDAVAPVIDTGPVALERLEYASAPPPPYPREAARRRLEGTVLLRVLVDIDGTPLDVLVQQSSGHRALDDAARKFVLAKWRFRPAMRGDVPVQAVGIVPIRFTVR